MGVQKGQSVVDVNKQNPYQPDMSSPYVYSNVDLRKTKTKLIKLAWPFKVDKSWMLLLGGIISIHQQIKMGLYISVRIKDVENIVQGRRKM